MYHSNGSILMVSEVWGCKAQERELINGQTANYWDPNLRQETDKNLHIWINLLNKLTAKVYIKKCVLVSQSTQPVWNLKREISSEVKEVFKLSANVSS